MTRVRLPKHRKQQETKGSWASPGLCAGALLVVLVYHLTGTVAQWWLWILVLVIAALVDGLFGVRETKEEKLRSKYTETRTTYRRPK